MSIRLERVVLPEDHAGLLEFLCGEVWPFHGVDRLSPDDVDVMEFATDDVAAFWMIADERRVGLVRLLDLGDIGDGAPQFDLRIANAHRRRGLGTAATRWVVDHLFSTYDEVHRIEANTRSDNVAMQRALASVGFQQEGRLRQSWRDAGGQWLDTLVYGILRAEW